MDGANNNGWLQSHDRTILVCAQHSIKHIILQGEQTQVPPLGGLRLPPLATSAQDRVTTNSLLAGSTWPFTLLLYPVCARTKTLPVLLFSQYSSSAQSVHSSFPIYIFSHSSTSLSATKIRSSAHNNSHGSYTHSSLMSEQFLITLQHNIPVAYLALWVKTSVGITNNWLNTEPWCNPTFTSKALLSPSEVLKKQQQPFYLKL